MYGIRVKPEGDHVEDSSIIALLLILPITFYSCRCKKLFARYAKALGYRKMLCPTYARPGTLATRSIS